MKCNYIHKGRPSVVWHYESVGFLSLLTPICVVVDIGIDNSVGLGEVDDNDNNNDNGPRHRHGLLFVQVCDVG